MSHDQYRLDHERAARADAIAQRRARRHFLQQLENEFGERLNRLSPAELAELADATLPGGREGIAFAGYCRRRDLRITDVVVRPSLLQALKVIANAPAPNS